MSSDDTRPVEGELAPDFNLLSDKGELIGLKDLKGKKIVLYFYPKDDTPGCTKESCDFRDTFDEFTVKGAVVIGISLDNQESHAKFAKKYDLPFTLLSDTDAVVSKAYGVYKKKNLYDKIFWGIERTTFVLDEENKIKKSSLE